MFKKMFCEGEGIHSKSSIKKKLIPIYLKKNVDLYIAERDKRDKEKVVELKDRVDILEAMIVPNLCMTCVGNNKGVCREIVRKEFIKFKKEMSPEFSRYEKWCRSLGNLIKLKISKKDEEKIKKYIEIAHLEIEPWQALTLSVMSFLSIFLLGLDRKSTRLNSSHTDISRMPSSA